MTDKLLSSFEVAGLHFKNRMVHAPTTLNMSDPLGHVTPKLVGAYESIAAGGSSATIVGATCVRRDGLINERMLGMYDDTYVIGHRDLVEVIHHNNSLAGIQLFYGGLIPGLGSTFPLQDGEGWIPGTISWGPSDRVPVGNLRPGIVPAEVYDSLVEDFAQSARRAREAGYDFISFHFCHGSLPHANISLIVNNGRNDEYADRFLFCERILQRTQELCGKEFPLIPRLCCDENLEGGYDIDYFVDHYAPRLHALGIAVLDCTFGSMFPAPSRNPKISSAEYIGPGFYTPNVVNLDNICQLRRKLVEKDIEIPLIGSANLGTPDHLRAMVGAGAAEFAGVCRLSLDDPDYANKIIEGREDEIRKSTRTGSSLLQGNIFGKGWAGSAQNPNFGRDREYRITRTASPKKIIVVGGGSGGMEYAITAHRIGHEVLLLEKSDRLGGAMDWAGNYRKLPNMEMLAYQPDFHRSEMRKWGVPHRLGVDVCVDDILANQPDVVVIATGSRGFLPDIPGLGEALKSGFAVQIDQALARGEQSDPGIRPIIYGAGIGAELAIDYALCGLKVCLLDPNSGFIPANYLGSRAPRVEALLASADVKFEPGVSIESFDANGVTLRMADGRLERPEADRFILALGRAPMAELARLLSGKRMTVQVIGDARQPRSYGNAIHEAAYLARQI